MRTVVAKNVIPAGWKPVPLWEGQVRKVIIEGIEQPATVTGYSQMDGRGPKFNITCYLPETNEYVIVEWAGDYVIGEAKP